MENSSIRIHNSSNTGLPIVTGCPIRVSDVAFDEDYVEVKQADGEVVHAQVHALNDPNQQGVQWIELSLLATTGGEAEIRPSKSSPPPGVFIVSEDDDGITLSNASVRVHLLRSPDQPPVRIKRKTSSVWELAGELSPEMVTEKGNTHRPDDEIRSLNILRNGEIRGQAELAGRLASLNGEASFNYRITVEVWRDQPAIRLDWMLMHEIPGCEAQTVHRATLDGVWSVGDDDVRAFLQRHYGPYYRKRVVRNPSPVALVSDFKSVRVCAEDPSMLLDDSEYAHYLKPPTVDTDEWLCVSGNALSVCATLVDFAETRPNRLHSNGNRLSYDLIPDGAPTQWAQGRRKEQTLLMTLGDGDADPVALGSSLSNVLTDGRAQPTVETLEALDSFDLRASLKHKPGRNVRLTSMMNSYCILNSPADKWNLGDTIDTHYSRGYPGIPNRFELKPGAPPMQHQFDTRGALYPPEIILFQEPVWTNNEYDIIHALAQETMRQGSNAHMGTLRWFARHNIEVDFLSFNDDEFHHRATPAHSEHHNTTGAYPSHFWTQGLLQYYLLTGDRDALEVAIALGDKTIECLNHPDAGTHSFDREFGWGLLSLVCLVESTGIERFLNAAGETVDFLQNFDRAGFSGAVNLSSGNASHSLERQMIEGAFGYASLVEGMDRYQKITGRNDTEEWLTTLLNQLLQAVWEKIDEGSIPGGLVLHILAIGFERTGDPGFLNAALVSLEHTDRSGGFRAGMGETKPNASSHRSYYRILGHLDRAGMLDRFELDSILARRSE